MKYLMFLVVLGGITIHDQEVYKEYIGGRKGFSYSHLVLYNNHTYRYSERYDFPGTLKVEGEWRVKDNKLMLTSSKRNKGNGNKKLFKVHCFELRDDEVIVQITTRKDKYTDVLKEKKLEKAD
jgi:hypothetical protein